MPFWFPSFNRQLFSLFCHHGGLCQVFFCSTVFRVQFPLLPERVRELCFLFFSFGGMSQLRKRFFLSFMFIDSFPVIRKQMRTLHTNWGLPLVHWLLNVSALRHWVLPHSGEGVSLLWCDGRLLLLHFRDCLFELHRGIRHRQPNSAMWSRWDASRSHSKWSSQTEDFLS